MRKTPDNHLQPPQARICAQAHKGTRTHTCTNKILNKQNTTHKSWVESSGWSEAWGNGGTRQFQAQESNDPCLSTILLTTSLWMRGRLCEHVLSECTPAHMQGESGKQENHGAGGAILRRKMEFTHQEKRPQWKGALRRLDGAKGEKPASACY